MGDLARRNTALFAEAIDVDEIVSKVWRQLTADDGHGLFANKIVHTLCAKSGGAYAKTEVQQ